MTTTEQIITILTISVCTIASRVLPFALFPSKKSTPRFVQFLGKYLASAVFGMLVVYCLKDVTFLSGNHGVPQLLGILACILLHLWRNNMLLTIAGGTLFYMLLVHLL